MTSRPFGRLILVGLLLLAAVCVRFGIAGAADITAQSADSLVASQLPDLLGPIYERGRVGWMCRPERAAEASSATNAELPTASHR